MDEVINQDVNENTEGTIENVLSETPINEEIDLSPILESMETMQAIQIEFFNNAFTLLLVLPIVIIACFAIKEFVDKSMRW